MTHLTQVTYGNFVHFPRYPGGATWKELDLDQQAIIEHREGAGA